MRRRDFLAATAAAALPAIGTAAPTANDRELVIGQSAVLSGPLAPVILGFNAGARLAIDTANGAGGIHGRTVRVISLDDELKPDRTLANYRKLHDEDNVFAFFGAVGTGNITAITPFLQECQAPMIGGYGVSDRARANAAGAAYIVRAGYGREVDRIVQHLASIGITRIALAHLATPGGEDILAAMRNAVKAQSSVGELVGSVGVKLDGSNAADAGRSLANTNAQAMVLFMSGAPVAEFIRSVQDSGGRAQFYGMSSVQGDTVAKTLGTRLPGGLAVAQVVPYPWSESDPTARDYRKRAEKAGVTINYYTYEGYINGLVLLEALKRAGKSPTRASLHAAMRAFKAKFGGHDLDFTTPGTSGSQLVEMVHVTPQGRFIR
jgi:branched-chain amino acid transport system substrate-binding protein